MSHSSTIKPQPITPASKRNWLFGFAIIAMVITTLPYLVGYYVQGDAWQFTGFVFGVEDGNTYLGKMLRGSSGDWLFRTPFSAYAQTGAFIFTHYILIGKLTASPGQHEQLVVLFHVFRFIGGILAIFATYDFLALFLKEERTRRWGVVLSTFGGGLGWVLVILGYSNWLGSLPLEFYSPESFGFLGFYGIAHLPWARAFFFWGIRAYLVRGGGEDDIPQPTLPVGNWNPGILWLFTGLSQPITGMVIGVVAGYHLLGYLFWQVIRKMRGEDANWSGFLQYFRTALFSGLVALPLVIYNAIAFTIDPFLSVWVEQSRIPSPHVLHYLVAYGLILPFAVVGAVRLIRHRPSIAWMPVMWLVLTPVLLSIPFSLQRRLVEGLWVILVLLALIAYEQISLKGFRRFYGLLAFTLPSTFFLIAGGFMAASEPAQPLFRPIEEVAAFDYLAREIDERTVILSAYDTGNAVPAWAPGFVVIGHRPESVRYTDLEPRVIAFFRENTTDDERFGLLNEFDIDYVFWGPAEKKYGNWNPTASRYLESVFSRGEYEIFEVVLP